MAILPLVDVARPLASHWEGSSLESKFRHRMILKLIISSIGPRQSRATMA